MLEQMIQSGSFNSTGADVMLALRSDVDFIRVFNNSTIGTSQNPGEAYYCEWQRGLAANEGWVTYNTNGALTLQMSKSSTLGENGFTLFNTATQNIIGINGDVTAVSNATQPQITTTTTAGLATGDTVTLEMPTATDMRAIGGIPYTIQVDDGTHFTLINAMANAPGNVFGADPAAWRQILRDPIFFPRVRFIANLTAANPCVITLTETHDFVRGERVRLIIPSVYESTTLNNVTATVTAVDPAVGTNTITLDLDATGITAFEFPVNGDYPFTKALVVPSGADQSYLVANNLDQLAAAYNNTAQLGITLSAGSLSPAGENTDVIFWQAFKSGIDGNS